ncbi:hypothetical protein C8Q77DRAFT_1158068 [Trametes polyzona]|nr:hypothetical protein C8Q77DRAFT_1158068 [Trametes polyzona]
MASSTTQNNRSDSGAIERASSANSPETRAENPYRVQFREARTNRVVSLRDALTQFHPGLEFTLAERDFDELYKYPKVHLIIRWQGYVPAIEELATLDTAGERIPVEYFVSTIASAYLRFFRRASRDPACTTEPTYFLPETPLRLRPGEADPHRELMGLCGMDALKQICESVFELEIVGLL